MDAARIISIAIKERGFENAKPSMLREHGKENKYAAAHSALYTDDGVEKVRTGITACKVSLVIYVILFMATLTLLPVLPLPPSVFRILDSDME
jgi:hypothetical protein